MPYIVWTYACMHEAYFNHGFEEDREDMFSGMHACLYVGRYACMYIMNEMHIGMVCKACSHACMHA